MPEYQEGPQFIEITLPNTKVMSIRLAAIDSIGVGQVYGRSAPSLDIKGATGHTIYSFEGADAELYYNKLMNQMGAYIFKPDNTPLPKPAPEAT